jgi:4-aminobutyrate aminotransferase-like enzyme
MSVEAGDCLGAVAATRALLPPHLHFQISVDLLGLAANFPTLVRPSEKDVWQSICPDPTALIGLPKLAAPYPAAAIETEQILKTRRAHLGRNLSLAYQQPLHIARGYMQHLYAADGRRYLDAVNNVAHVGHSHPHVVKAAQAQNAVLNTNSRYLHSNLARYAERLLATLPEPLRVVYFVCSGSEANELALRLARTYTGSPETIVLDRAYHGNTNALIEISPYKYERAGGAGQQPHIHQVAIPDIYRGPFKADDPQAGAKYARPVAEAAHSIAAHNLKPTFICESLMGSAGQIPLAPEYLRAAYAAVRAVGGVCIADEVQVGLGRVGDRFWGFQLQNVIPDIVTLGKPLGNGHPLAAVITTPAIAEAFDNGMEYFNTFGGNPVSCAIGLAVLEVIENEGLQTRAREVGAYFLAGLRQLQAVHPIIGDARGAGLFLGVELVRDQGTLTRAVDEATYVVNRLKELGILISADFNSLKIKPPLQFTQADADLFIERLNQVLQEDFVRR